MKMAIALFLWFGLVWLDGCNPAGVAVGPQSGVVGKWQSMDGSYVAEFLPNGNCSVKMRMQGREVGGACTYTVDAEKIVLYHAGMSAAQGGGKEAATWKYTLNGETMSVAVLGTSIDLKRVH